ncbi:hypothetical protein A5821_000139 [Enterococcus sp. 7F3_DIV0205]|uniref:WxL domain-containing protein n=1 Tax=Candidatus Enterococcus palustris TaxID=1834189 RepID=A0AAQ3Y5X1_9ENTE|nr:hypothetical protein [Enterococcus sp. 7F3_DIV0205]OTN84545.1 hypothetical protein A5821_000473 [Enterococcus sp. 7F3_DIV0205]
MKKNKWRASIAIGFMLLGIYYINSSKDKAILAAPENYNDILLAPGINIANGVGTETEIPGDFGTMFKLTKDVSYEVKGLKDPVNDVLVKTGSGINDPKASKVFRFSPDNIASEKSVLVKNAGLYNGRSIDLKLVIDKMDISPDETTGKYPYVNFMAVNYNDKDKTDEFPSTNIKVWNEMFLMFGSATRSSSGFNDAYAIGDKVDYHYEFFDHETGAKVDFHGTWNFNNINGLKAVTTDFDGDFSNLYVLKDTWIGYLKDTPTAGKLELYGTNTTVNSERSLLTQLFSGKTFYTSLERRAATTSVRPSQMVVMYGTQSLARIAPATPIVYGVKNEATHTDASYLDLTYSILQTIPDNKIENRDDSFKIETEVPSFYDIDVSAIKVFEYGTDSDWTSLFKIEKDPSNASKLILKADLSTAANAENFNGKVFDIKIKAKTNTSFNFNKNDTAYGYQASGADNGYMTFELAGPKTSASYTYTTSSGGTLSDTLESKIIDGQTKSKVLYEGVPNADSKENIKIPVGANLTTDYPDPGDSFLENIRVDTENLIDQPVVVTYTKGKALPDTSVLGETTLWLTLTTAKNVTKDIEVKVTIVPTAAELRVKYKINGSYMTDKYPDYVDSTQMIGAPINLKQIKQVTDRLAAITEAGYTQTNTPTEEFTLSVSGNTVIYEFEGALFLASSPSLLDFGIEEASYKAIRVNEAKLDKALIIKDTRAIKQKWTLSAKLTQDFTLTETSGTKKVLSGILRYNDGTDEEKKFNLSENLELLIDEHTTSTEYDVSKTWNPKGKGFKLDVPGDAVKTLGKYQAKIEFTVNATP